jgi:hypothetical protein
MIDACDGPFQFRPSHTTGNTYSLVANVVKHVADQQWQGPQTLDLKNFGVDDFVGFLSKDETFAFYNVKIQCLFPGQDLISLFTPGNRSRPYSEAGFRNHSTPFDWEVIHGAHFPPRCMYIYCFCACTQTFGRVFIFIVAHWYSSPPWIGSVLGRRPRKDCGTAWPFRVLQGTHGYSRAVL